MIEIIPAILTDKPDVFSLQLQEAINFGAETIQIDFTDGKFVPSHTLLPDDLDAIILSKNNLTLEAHLMTEDPEQYLNTLYTLGFKRVAVHIQALTNADTIIEAAHELGLEIGFALNPDVAVDHIEPYTDRLDFVLFLTVVPGEQGHPFEKEVLTKVHLEHLHHIKRDHKELIIEVDGGVNEVNLKQVINAGAERIVVGSAIWQSLDPEKTYRKLKQIANE